ncbi:MAG: ExbD/TolR family protein [Planctomycetota bacterium]|jgi:biopolymer transport protein ExbD
MTAPENEKAVGDLTPLIDIAFLILIFFMCLPFRSLDAKLDAHLPRSSGIHVEHDAQIHEFLIKIHILGRDERTRSWGEGERVRAPSRALYKFQNGRTTDDLDVVLAHIRRMQRAAYGLPNTSVRGEIKAGPRVQHKYIIAVLNRFAEAKLKDVDFYGTRIPGARALRARCLPYPE